MHSALLLALFALVAVAAACSLDGTWKDRNGFVDWGSGVNGSSFAGRLSVKEVSCGRIDVAGTYSQAANGLQTTVITNSVVCVNSNTTAGSCDLVCGFFQAPLVFNWNANCTAFVDAFGDTWTAGSTSISASLALLLALIAVLMLA